MKNVKKLTNVFQLSKHPILYLWIQKLGKVVQSTIIDGQSGHWDGRAVSALSCVCVVSTLQVSLETVPAILFGGQ